jgi:hypothetical protein
MTNPLLSNVTDNLNTWWGLTSVVQDQVKQLVPNKNSWTLHVTKHKSGVWVFSLPQFMTFNESFCNGTENVFDFWYEKQTGSKPVVGSSMKVTVSKVMPQWFDCKLLHMYCDTMWPDANYYFDKVSGLDVWLCPYLQVLFKEVPEHLYVKFDNCV